MEWRGIIKTKVGLSLFERGAGRDWRLGGGPLPFPSHALHHHPNPALHQGGRCGRGFTNAIVLSSSPVKDGKESPLLSGRGPTPHHFVPNASNWHTLAFPICLYANLTGNMGVTIFLLIPSHGHGHTPLGVRNFYKCQYDLDRLISLSYYA